MSIFLFSLLHPVHSFFHAFLAAAFVLVDVQLIIMLAGAEFSSDDFFDFLVVLDAHVLLVLAEGFLLVLLVDVNCVINQLFKVSVQVNTLVLLFLSCIVNLFDHIVVIFVVRALLSLLLQELGCVASALLSDFAPFSNHHCELSQLSEVTEFL